jgi:hypothetical protein
MSDCALYNQLFPLVQHHIASPDLSKLVPLLRQLDEKGLQLVSLLIQTHSSLHSSSSSSTLPYQGSKVNSEQAQFDIRHFDPVLQHMLVEFCKNYLSVSTSSL